MNKLNLMPMIVLMSMVAYAVERSEEAKRVVRDGATAKLTFRVTDSLGVPVTNANVNARFQFLTVSPNHTIEGNTCRIHGRRNTTHCRSPTRPTGEKA